MTTSAEGPPQYGGVEIRVHGVGDHGVFSALGKPIYTAMIADRVRVGSLPLLPKHELKLINWSRPSRKISRTFTWYLAYPFTLLNMAGFMGPVKSEDRAEMRLWWFTRTLIVISSLMMTVAMAMWITVIVETASQLLYGEANGLRTVVLCAFAPGLLAAIVVNRMTRGRPLVDQGNHWVSLLTLGVLAGTAGYLAGRAAAREAIFDLPAETARDPMSFMISTTTLIAWTFAIVLCFIAWRAESRRNRQQWTGKSVIDRTALAGAGILIAFAIAILHTAGSGIRLVLQTVLKYTPPAIERRVLGAQEGARVTEAGAYEYFNQILPIDLVPVFFLVSVVVFVVLFSREYRRRKPRGGEKRPHRDECKATVPIHALLMETHEFLARTALVAMVISIALWLVLAALVFAGLNQGWVDDELVTPLLIVLKIAGLLLLIVIAVRRPEHVVDRVRRTLGSLADVAGFWAPDLHPLAGASYRLAVLRGIRRGISDVRKAQPGRPIALVGHSQGSVICAWFVRGGHWEERQSESTSDEKALVMGLHQVRREQSQRVALFTCGSPLDSLYRTFFPRHFNDDFFRTALNMSHGNIWNNYWRNTDPIGSRLRGDDTARNGNRPQVQNIDVTELECEEMKGHGEYWQDNRIRRDVEAYFACFGASERTEDLAAVGNGRQRRLRGLRVAFSRLHLHGN